MQLMTLKPAQGLSSIVFLTVVVIVSIFSEVDCRSTHTFPNDPDYNDAESFPILTQRVQKKHSLMAPNHKISSQDKENMLKRGGRSQRSCPPGMSERDCNYELMAVWMRMLMKES